jgi:protein-S-isoprenylcysteine O-methyltransferase Ste14
MNPENDKKGADVKVPPPLIFLLSLLAAYGAQRFWPIGIGNFSGLKPLGAIVIILGICITILVSLSFKRAETTIEPWKPTSKIVSTGIFAYSRNPAYLALCLTLMGIGIFLNNFWILISFIPSAILVYYIAIRKEETYLEKKFGGEYVDYKSKVRRWL